MIEFLNEENEIEFVKLYNKSIKKNVFLDIHTMELNKCILLCKESSSYVGYFQGYIDKCNLTGESVAHIIALYVLPAYRNEGKAFSMLKTFEEWIKKNQCSKIIVDISLKNKKSVEFFEKVEFENLGTIISMQKNI